MEEVVVTVMVQEIAMVVVEEKDMVVVLRMTNPEKKPDMVRSYRAIMVHLL